MPQVADFLTVRETAARLRQSPDTIRRKIHSGEIEAVRLTPERGPYRIPVESLEAWLASSRAVPDERRAGLGVDDAAAPGREAQ